MDPRRAPWRKLSLYREWQSGERASVMQGHAYRNLDNPPMANWSVQKTLDDMDKGGVATAITSPTTPQVTPLEKGDATRIARQSNEYAKKLMSDHPGRFAVFAMLPMPHIDESLKEIVYAFDVLKVDGVGV